MDSGEALWLADAAHQSHAVGLEQRFKQVGAAMLEHCLDFIVAGVVPEALIEKINFFKFDWGALIANHKLLEAQETQVPRVTLLVRYELRQSGGCLDFRAIAELPDDTVTWRVTLEGLPLFVVLGLICWHWHHADIGHHIPVVRFVKDHILFIVSVEQVIHF